MITYKNIRHFTLKFLKDFKDIEIITDVVHMLVIEYGWADFEEFNANVVTVNYVDHTIRKEETGYSCEGGDYEDDDTMHFADEHDLYANFCKGIRENFN